MADALDESRDKTLAGKRATLEAMANHGSAGVADLAAQQQVIQSSHDAALNTLTAEAVGRGAPAAALGQLQDIAGQPGANAGRIMGQAGDAYAADAARLQTAHGNYMDEASAAVPVIRADADRRIGILREQWEQRKKLQEESEAKDFLDMPQYLQDAYLNATLGAGPEGMAAIDAELAGLAPQINEEQTALGNNQPVEVHGRDGRVIPTRPAGVPWVAGARADAEGRVFIPDAESDTGYRLIEGNAGAQLIGPMDADPVPKTSQRLDMLKTRRDQLLEQKDTLVPSGEGAWDPSNPDDVAAAYGALGVDPMAAAGLAMQYVNDNSPTASQQLAEQNAQRDLQAQSMGFNSYEDMLEATGMEPPADRPEGILRADQAAEQLGGEFVEDEDLLSTITASDYYADAIETAESAIKFGKENGTQAWADVAQQIEDSWAEKFPGKKFGRTLELLHEMYADTFR